MKRITDFLTGLRSLVSSIVVIIVSIALITILYRQLNSSATIVEPIRVPDTLAKSGYTPEITAQRLMDGMFAIKRQATTLKDGTPVSPEWERFDMEVPGSGITIGTIGNVLRESMGIKEQKITGEIISSDSDLHLRLRLSGNRQFSDSVRQGSQEVEALLEASAEQAVKLIEPFMYASYLYASGRTDEMMKALDYCDSHCSDKDRKWAHNLRGVRLAEKGNLDGAIEWYQKALEDDPRFAIAYHNWAKALAEKGQNAQAYEKIIDAERLGSNLTSAEDKAVLKVKIGQQMHKNDKPIADEIEQYELALKLNPHEADAYKFWGQALKDNSSPDYRTAAEKFSKAVEKTKSQQPVDTAEIAEIYALWGHVLVELKDYDAAISKYQLALENDQEGWEYLSEDIANLRLKLQ